MVDWLRTEMPIGSTVGVEPLSTYIPSLVKASYTVPVPKYAADTVYMFVPLYLRQEAGNDPLYPHPRKSAKDHPVQEPRLWQDILAHHVDFLLVSPWRAEAARETLGRLPQRYRFMARFSTGAEIWKIVGNKSNSDG